MSAFAMQWPHARELAKYLREFKPELARELQGRPLHLVRERLNEITGLTILPGAQVNDSCRQYLVALRAGVKRK